MEEEIKDKKIPGFILSTFLFLFFYLLFRTICEDVSNIYYNMIDAAVAEDEPINLTLFLAALDIVMLSLSLWSIIRILKGKADGITCLRWALYINILVTLFQSRYTVARAVTISYWYILPSLIHLLFVVVFLLYLRRSKYIHTSYPVSERRYSPGGWAWTFFILVCGCFFTFIGYKSYKKGQNSNKISVSSLYVPSGQYSNGSIMYDKQSLHDKSIKIWSGVSEKSRHYDYMSILLPARPVPDSLFISEVSSCNTIIDDCQYYMDQYEYKKDTLKYIWTFSVRFDSNSEKYCAYSRYTSDTNYIRESKEAFDFLKTVIFDLTPYRKKQ